jgi:hypothetical protein
MALPDPFLIEREISSSSLLIGVCWIFVTFAQPAILATIVNGLMCWISVGGAGLEYMVDE